MKVYCYQPNGNLYEMAVRARIGEQAKTGECLAFCIEQATKSTAKIEERCAEFVLNMKKFVETNTLLMEFGEPSVEDFNKPDVAERFAQKYVFKSINDARQIATNAKASSDADEKVLPAAAVAPANVAAAKPAAEKSNFALSEADTAKINSGVEAFFQLSPADQKAQLKKLLILQMRVQIAGKKIAEDLVCSICHEVTAVPKLLGACGHTACEPCLKTLHATAHAALTAPRQENAYTKHNVAFAPIVAPPPSDLDKLQATRCPTCRNEIIAMGFPVFPLMEIAKTLVATDLLPMEQPVELLNQTYHSETATQKHASALKINDYAQFELAKCSVDKVIKRVTAQQWRHGVYLLFEAETSMIFFETFAKTLHGKAGGVNVLVMEKDRMLVAQLSGGFEYTHLVKAEEVITQPDGVNTQAISMQIHFETGQSLIRIAANGDCSIDHPNNYFADDAVTIQALVTLRNSPVTKPLQPQGYYILGKKIAPEKPQHTFEELIPVETYAKDRFRLTAAFLPESKAVANAQATPPIVAAGAGAAASVPDTKAAAPQYYLTLIKVDGDKEEKVRVKLERDPLGRSGFKAQLALPQLVNKKTEAKTVSENKPQNLPANAAAPDITKLLSNATLQGLRAYLAANISAINQQNPEDIRDFKNESKRAPRP